MGGVKPWLVDYHLLGAQTMRNFSRTPFKRLTKYGMVEVQNFHLLKRPFLTQKCWWFFVTKEGGGSEPVSVTFVTKMFFFIEGFPKRSETEWLLRSGCRVMKRISLAKQLNHPQIVFPFHAGINIKNKGQDRSVRCSLPSWCRARDTSNNVYRNLSTSNIQKNYRRTLPFISQKY